MMCSDTDGKLPAVHVDNDVLELAQALTPYVRTVHLLGGGNGDIILPFRKGTLETIRLDIQSKLKKLLHFKQS